MRWLTIELFELWNEAWCLWIQEWYWFCDDEIVCLMVLMDLRAHVFYICLTIFKRC